MNKYQQKLTEDHLEVVKWVIYRHIKVNENITGLGYDDIYQEGCAALCRAAVSFDGSVRFVTYAQVVVKNSLISYCRDVCRKFGGVRIPLEDAQAADSGFQPVDREPLPEDCAIDADILRILDSLGKEYTGTAKLGIEALSLKIRGCTGADIARMYGVKPNLVGAWISRAAEKLRKNERFSAYMER